MSVCNKKKDISPFNAGSFRNGCKNASIKQQVSYGVLFENQ